MCNEAKQTFRLRIQLMRKLLLGVWDYGASSSGSSTPVLFGRLLRLLHFSSSLQSTQSLVISAYEPLNSLVEFFGQKKV